MAKSDQTQRDTRPAMGRAARGLLYAWRQALVELLLYYPALLLAGSFAMADAALAWWLPALSLFYTAGYVYRGLLAIRRRLLLIPLCAATALLVAWACFGVTAAAAVAAAFGGLALYRGVASCARAWPDLFTTAHYAVGLFAYFLLTAYLRLAPSPDVPLAASVPWLGLLSLAVTLFAANRTSLDREADIGADSDGGGQTARTSSSDSAADAIAPHSALTRTAIRDNRLLVAGLFAFVLVVGFIGSIRDAFVWLKNRLVELVGWLLSLMNTPADPPKQPEASAPPPQQLPLEQGEPSFLAKLLEQIIMVAAYVVISALALIALFYAGKALVRLARKLAAWLGRSLSNDNAPEDGGNGYEDESESLLDWQHMLAGYRQRWRNRFAGRRDEEPAWDALPDNGARIRYLYRRLLKHGMAAGYRLQPQLTPRETLDDLVRWNTNNGAALPKTLLRAYEQTRYGETPIDDETVARAVREAPPLKRE